MKKSERLLPRTDALPAATVEWRIYEGKQLVRYRHRDGTTERCLTPNYREAEAFYFRALAKLREESKP